MPTTTRRDDAIIELFVSASEDCAWKDSHIDGPDRAKDGAVEALITQPDGKTLAIGHTMIEPFAGEREDIERSKRFLQMENDPALRQIDRRVNIDMPRVALPYRSLRFAWTMMTAFKPARVQETSLSGDRLHQEERTGRASK